MKNQVYKIIFVFVLSLQLAVAVAQPDVPEELHSLLINKTSFYDVKSTINDYFRSKRNITTDSIEKRIVDKKLKHWNRYFWWNEHFVNGEGKIEDYNQRVLDAKEEQLKNEPGAMRHQVNLWQQDGPDYNIFDLYVGEGMGRFDVVAFHPTNTNIIFAGSTNGGIFKTTNGGASWYSLSSYLPTLGVSAICVHPTNPDIIYVFSGDSNSSQRSLVNQYQYRSESEGIYKTVDGGDTWNRTDTLPLTNFRPRDLIMDKDNPSTLLAATSEGIAKTTNGGQSWIMVTPVINIWEMKYKPGSSNIIYAASDSLFFRSSNGGNTFVEQVEPLLEPGVRISIAVTPADDDIVMLLVGSEDDDMVGVFKSTNSGLDFNLIYDDPEEDLFMNYMDQDVLSGQVIYNNTIAIHPSDENIVVVGGLCIWSSDDGGESWTQETSYHAPSENWGAEHIHPDIHQLAYNTDGKLYCANDGGIYVSDDDGDDWDFIEHGLTATQFYHFEVYNDEDDTWGGTQDNGILERDNGDGGFYMYYGGDGYDVMTDHPWQVDGGESDDIYYTYNQFIRTDNTDISVPAIEEDPEFFGNLGMDPTDEDHIYAGYNDLYESFDAGSSWQLLSTRNASWCLSTCQTNADRLYFAGPGGSNTSTLTRRDGDEDSFLAGGLIDAGFVNGLKITDIEVSTSNSDNVYVSSSGFVPDSKVFFSSDAGDTWINLSFNLPNVPVFSLVRDPSGGVYAGTYLGVYYKRSGINYWEPFYNGLPPVPVTEMELYNVFNGVPNNIMISTFGRGIWKTLAYQSCPDNISIAGDIEGRYYRDASNDILSNQEIKPSAGTSIKYNAGNQIRLIPGFHAKGPGLFKTYLTGCSTEIELD